MQEAGYTIGSENTGTIQGINLSSSSVTIEEGGNTAEVTATLSSSEGSTNYVLVNGLYYPLTVAQNGDITLGETGKANLTNSEVSLSDVTLTPTGSINATLNSSTGKVTITSGTVTADENSDKVELKYNNTTYATINVAVKKASISIPATADVPSGSLATITATLDEYQTNGQISWSITSGSSYASIPANSTGTSVTVTGGTTTGQTATLRATYTTGTATATADCTVTVKQDDHIADKSYVDYNVSYTDVYTGTTYRSDNGWRLLTDLSAYESAGTYTGNIEIISTGIPAKLRYYDTTITSFENTSPATVGKWAGDSTQRTTYKNTYYSYNNSTSNKNIYAAAGLMYNFENIVFNVTGTTSTLIMGKLKAFESNSTRNYGGYVSIWNEGSAITACNSTTGASLFRVSNLASGTIPEGGIRSVSLKDLTGLTTSNTTFTDKRTGLFTLQNYTQDEHTSGYYWLASPSSNGSYNLCHVYSNGNINSNDSGPHGLHPVVSISNVKLELNGNVWSIVANNS